MTIGDNVWYNKHVLRYTKNTKIFMNKKGFTFIEVIIIFTIIFIMTAALLSTSYKDRNRKELQAVAREVTASIREAQNYALTGKQKGSGTMPCTFQYAMNSNGYQIKHETRNLDDHDCSGNFNNFFEEVSLPNNVQMEARAFDASRSAGSGWADVDAINFDVPYGKITIHTGDAYPNSGVEIILSKNDKYYHICLHTTGLIEDIGITENSNTVCAFN